MSVYPHDISKTDAAIDRSNKLRIEMFHRESWKPTSFGVMKSKVKVTRHKKQRRHGFYTLLSAGL